MGSLDLGGFDVVVHLAESVINQGLELLPSGSTFPVREREEVTLTALAVPMPVPGTTKDVDLIYDAFLEIERPQVELDQANGRVTVRCDLSPASQLIFMRTAIPDDISLLTGIVQQIPIAGTVELNCPFSVQDVTAVWGSQVVSGRAAVARAGGVNASLSLVVPSADGAGNVVLATSVTGTNAVTVTVGAIQTAVQPVAGTDVGNAIGDLPLTNPVRLNAGPTGVETARAVVASISPVGSPTAISLGVLTDTDPPSPGAPRPPAPPNVLGAAGALIWASNYWTLQLVVQALRTAHPGMAFEVNRDPPSASFDGAVVVDGGDEPITIRELDITVDANGGLFVDGFATASGGCWDADIDFDFVFTFTCDPDTGAVQIGVPEPPNVDVDVDKDLWCQIIGAILGAIGGFIVGAIIGAIAGGGPGALIGGIIGGVAGGIGGFIAAGHLIDPLDLDGVSLDSISVLGGLTLPLPVGGAGFVVETCDFDDLAVRGGIVYADLAERHRTGSATLTVGSGIDLDAGAVRPALGAVADDAADLLWAGTALQTLPGAVIGPVFGSDVNGFATLSLTDLEGFSYGEAPIHAGQIPVSFPILWAARHEWISFAVRTDEGRYAKCRCRRDLAGTLHIEYVVYARPSMCLGSVVTLETLSKTVVESGTETCTEVRDVEVFTPQFEWPVIVDVRPSTALTSLALVDDVGSRVPDRPEPPPGTRFPGLVDVPDWGVLAPPKPPSRSCGKNTTVEHKEADWYVADRKQRATIQALPTGVVAPLTYRWRAFGAELTGSGTTTIGAIQATYNENSPILTLVAEEGDDVIGSVVIHATDADGRKLRVTRQINSPSQQRFGGCCPKTPTKLTFLGARRFLEKAGEARRIYDVNIARLRRLGAWGEVPEREPIALAAAVEKLDDRGGG